MFYRQHPRVFAPVGELSRTKQSHKDECDIHKVLNQYKRTGIITHVQSARPLYTDLPSDYDFQSSLNTVLQAQETFSALPAKVRDHFGNDPARFLAAFGDPDQADQLREFGLLKPAPEPTREPLEAPPAPVDDS